MCNLKWMVQMVPTTQTNLNNMRKNITKDCHSQENVFPRVFQRVITKLFILSPWQCNEMSCFHTFLCMCMCPNWYCTVILVETFYGAYLSNFELWSEKLLGCIHQSIFLFPRESNIPTIQNRFFKWRKFFEPNHIAWISPKVS